MSQKNKFFALQLFNFYVDALVAEAFARDIAQDRRLWKIFRYVTCNNLNKSDRLNVKGI